MIMNQISVSQARQDFLNLTNRVYSGEEFLVLKNKIPMMVMKPVRLEKRTIRKSNHSKIFGMWKNRKDFVGLSTIQIADRLREVAWKGNYAS